MMTKGWFLTTALFLGSVHVATAHGCGMNFPASCIVIIFDVSLKCNSLKYAFLYHHNIQDVPHYSDNSWSWVKGAFMTIDRPYPFIFDFLHHKIGTTHVVHHICSRIPHYNALKATQAIKEKFPRYYLYDQTPIIPALLRVAKRCVATVPEGDRNYFTYSF